MGKIQKYMGVEGVDPRPDKMGGKSWERIKAGVKRTTEKIAGELLKLYAARKVQQGHAFGEADAHFYDFENGFPYEETADQSKAIEDVLSDMRHKQPMDRLVCGDVGYGKTEVALRAAFLAASEARQVAVLVPTTVLAEQHYESFRHRFSRYPVQVACLSRFRSAKEQRGIVEGIRSGNIDIVVGTHRLLQKDIEFKALGLLVLDEEQRFGVRHKERIKRMRKTVDVLTLTATPIPRTLHLSLLGIRDISIINTPPEERRPILTYITELDDTVIAEAVRKELARGGQVYFVHNTIQTIERMADHLRKLVPEARSAVAHGRMAEEELERVMLDFMKGRIDMLVCTTIIESGLDVPAANTILINRADRFGLSQIYQLRGRVGRSDEQAYAYLFIPAESTLTKDAQKRLKVLMEYSDLGSGFQIAMSDLKIRGGGTILGASQSGHIAAVGYDMFLQLMETSIAEIKGEPHLDPLEPEINLPLSAFLPERYIADIDQRLTLYRRLARMGDLKSIGALKAEMTDRFGRPPEEATNLLLKIMLKVLAVKAGVKRLDMVDSNLHLQFSELHQKRPFGIAELVAGGGKGYRFTPDHVFKAKLAPGAATAQLAQVKNILIEISRHVNH
jgi:transcription-repair coupling factor (superfamily II helicase)